MLLWAPGPQPGHHGHEIRNSLHTALNALGMSIPKLIAGTVVIENIFAWPGHGQALRDRHFQRGLPGDSGLCADVVLSNFAVDMITTLMDPRMRQEV